MDPKVCGKLLTTHRRGLGDDVEALHDRFPLRQIAGKGPKMGSHGYRRLRRWKSGFVAPLMFLGYKSIYRRKKYVGGATRGPRGWGRAYPLGAPSCLVDASWRFWLQFQVFWFAFGRRKILAKVSFHLDSVWIPFLQNSKIDKKTETGTGPPVNRLVPKII